MKGIIDIKAAHMADCNWKKSGGMTNRRSFTSMFFPCAVAHAHHVATPFVYILIINISVLPSKVMEPVSAGTNTVSPIRSGSICCALSNEPAPFRTIST